MDRLVVTLVPGITSPDPELRARSADEVTDVHRGLVSQGVAVLAHVLVAARLVESVRDCQESQLHALAELSEWHEIPADAIARLRELAATDDPSQIEYLSFLLDGRT